MNVYCVLLDDTVTSPVSQPWMDFVTQATIVHKVSQPEIQVPTNVPPGTGVPWAPARPKSVHQDTTKTRQVKILANNALLGFTVITP